MSSEKPQWFAEAEDGKARGNAALQSGDIPSALSAYTAAAKVLQKHLQEEDNEDNDGDGASSGGVSSTEIKKLLGIIFSNTSAAFATGADWASALRAAESCVAIRPEWAKAHTRAGSALLALQRNLDAVNAFQLGLDAAEGTPAEKEAARAGVEQAKAAMAAAQARAEQAAASRAGAGADGDDPMMGGAGPGAGNPLASALSGNIFEKLAAMPQVAPLLQDPEVATALRELQAAGGAGLQSPEFAKHLQNQKVMTCVAALMGVHIPTQEEQMEEARKREAAEDEARRARQRAKEEEEKRAAEEAAAAEAAKRSPEQAQALEAKERGNAAYRKRQFDDALKAYGEAIALDPANNVFLNNRAAVHFEMGDLDAAAADSNEALEKEQAKSGLERDDNVVARAQSRLGSVAVKRRDFELAVEMFEKSLVNARTAPTLKALQNAEAQLRRQKRAATVDVAGAAAKKEEGNTAFREGRLPDAIKAYGEAIKLSPDDGDKEVLAGLDDETRHALAVLYSNRAATYTKMAEHMLGIKDCERAIALSPKFVKAMTRKGHLHFFMKEYQMALETYDKALELAEGTEDPAMKEAQEQEIRESVTRTLTAMQQRDMQSSDAPDEDTIRAAQRDPEIQAILTDPVMNQILQDMQTDPSSIQDHMKNPMIAAKIQKLIGAGILRTR